MSKSRNGRGDWIQTFSGLAMFPLDPRPEEIALMDIARALSNTCRFPGHTHTFYSVAEHSVHVSRLVPQEDRAWGLLHDASEAYLCDIARPLKRLPEFSYYRRIERQLQSAIAERFGLDPDQPAAVTAADDLMLAVEASELIAPLLPGWEKWIERIAKCKVSVASPWNPERAFREFMMSAGAAGLF